MFSYKDNKSAVAGDGELWPQHCPRCAPGVRETGDRGASIVRPGSERGAAIVRPGWERGLSPITTVSSLRPHAESEFCWILSQI